MTATQEPTFLILTSLATRPEHGCGITQEAVEGTVSLRVGTLDGVLSETDASTATTSAQR